MVDRIVTTEELTAWTGVSALEIGVLADRGIIEEIARDRWPLKATVVALVRYYGEAAAGRVDEDARGTVH